MSRVFALIVCVIAVLCLIPWGATEAEAADPEWICVGDVGCQGYSPDDVKWCNALDVKQPIIAPSEISACARLAELCRKKVEAENSPRAYLCGLAALWRAKCTQVSKPGGSCPNAERPAQDALGGPSCTDREDQAAP